MAIAIVLAGAAGACSEDRPTILQVDVQYAPELTFARLRFSVGETETRTWQPSHRDGGADGAGWPGDGGGAMPADGGGSDGRAAAGWLWIGVDMRLPRSLVGPQPVTVRALDDADCVVASNVTEVVLRAGERVQGGVVSLAVQSGPDCDWQGDAGAEHAAMADGAGDAGDGAPADAAPADGPPRDAAADAAPADGPPRDAAADARDAATKPADAGGGG